MHTNILMAVPFVNHDIDVVVGVEGGGGLESAVVHDREGLALGVCLQEIYASVLRQLGSGDLSDAQVHVHTRNRVWALVFRNIFVYILFRVWVRCS